MKQVVAASTPWVPRTESPEKPTLAPRMVEAAVLRLRWISLCCAAVTAFTVYLESWLQPEVGRLLKDPLLSLMPISVVVAALLLNAAQRYRLLSPITILNLGLAFEIIVAASISFSETALPRSTDGASRAPRRSRFGSASSAW